MAIDPLDIPPKIFTPQDCYGGTWLIPSRSHNNSEGAHTVHLFAYDRRGECTCKDWNCRVGTAAKAGNWVTCYHVRVARERFQNWAIYTHSLADKNTPDSEQT